MYFINISDEKAQGVNPMTNHRQYFLLLSTELKSLPVTTYFPKLKP